jgi:alpha-beta hydrolase superfamily lysophospholipase
MATSHGGSGGQHRNRRSIWAALLLASLAACGSAASAAGQGTSPGIGDSPAGAQQSAPVTGSLAAFYRSPRPLAAAPAGTIIRSQPLPTGSGLPAGTRAYRVLFHSTSIGGADIAESGMVVIPGGTPPPGGFPIVSWAHGTTGVAAGCAPSVEGTASLPDLRALLRDRIIVAATDYEGQGGPGLHPYLVGLSEAQGVLDAARAARALAGASAGNTVIAAGYSQGGQAALFTGEVAQSYAPELFLAGVAAVAPVASLVELAPPPARSTAGGQTSFVVMALYAWSHFYGTFGLGSVLTPAGVAASPVIASACTGAVSQTFDTRPPGRTLRDGWQNVPAVQAADAANEPGSAPTSAPILILQGTRDTLVPYAATTELVRQRLCRNQYDTVDYVPEHGSDHDAVLGAGANTLIQWIVDRIDGTTGTDSCANGDLTRDAA